jgi:hypothetical protein
VVGELEVAALVGELEVAALVGVREVAALVVEAEEEGEEVVAAEAFVGMTEGKGVGV